MATERPATEQELAELRRRVLDDRSLTGRHLVFLMRRYRVTIRELAERTGITQRRIRQV